MSTPSPSLISLLGEIRSHPGLKELLAQVPRPRVSRWRPSSNSPASLNDAAVKYVYESGQMEQYEKWIEVLTGKPVNLTDNRD